MKFDGEMLLPLPVATVWAQLSDVGFLVESIPGAEEIRDVRADGAVCKLRPGFSFVRGTLELTVARLETEPEKSVGYRLVSKGIGSSSEVVTHLHLIPQETGTQVQWTAEVANLTGLLKAVPKGLVQGAAQSVIKDVWDSVAKRLREQAEKEE